MTPLRILFALPSPEYLRYYDATMRLLAERGHQVSVAIAKQKEQKQARLEGFDSENIRLAGRLPARGGIWCDLASDVRGAMDFGRYLDPKFAAAPALRDRMKRKALPWYLHWLDRYPAVEASVVRRWVARLARIEAIIPTQRPLTAFLREQHADLLVVSPLVEAGGDQVDLIKSARELRLPTVVAVASWDNLTNKGLLRVQPDRLVLWNHAQKAEAIAFHGMDPERISVTGAQPFDRWFGREPSRTREAFASRVGLSADRPIVLFTGSSVFISRGDAEVPFVKRWIAALRNSESETIRNAAVLIRPHPYNADQWLDADLTGLGVVSVWPRGRHNPVDEANRADYFDSLYYASAIVGINTSAMVEATIIGRPVLSILADEFTKTQEGTLHFHHLMPENGGFLRLGRTLDEHVSQLEEVLERPELVRQQISGFVASFLRPNGVDRPAVPILADALEAAAVAGPAPLPPVTAALPLLRLLLLPLAAWAFVAERAAPMVKRAKEPKKLAERVWRVLMKGPHRARLGSRHAARTIRRVSKRTVVYGYRGTMRAAHRVVRFTVLKPLRAARRLAARVKGAATSGPPVDPQP